MSNQDEQTDENEFASRYVVGIDLGTTNSAVAFVDTESAERSIQYLQIPQLIDPTTVDSSETLPSFALFPTEADRANFGTHGVWGKGEQGWLTGRIARDHGSLTPARQVVSAKSWLCHQGVDRTANLLPWQAVEDVDKLSPIAASSLYLRHLVTAWDRSHTEHRLSEQEVVLTIPASFDEMAREFTVEAAKLAGLHRLTLIEEPQAAFYAWLHRHKQDWEQVVSPGDVILVCDIGGGTTDFTLIHARGEQADGLIRFHRLAVGDHLILGGDNLDLAVAHYLEQKLSAGRSLDHHDWDRLLRQSRSIKEQALCDDPPKQLSIHLARKGSRLIGGSLQTTVEASEIRDLLMDGFYPRVELTAVPEVGESGFTEFGLPYAADPAITKHLAYFLRQHASDLPTDDLKQGTAVIPDVVLFNGGMFESPFTREAIVSQLREWYRPIRGNDWSPLCLDHARLDLSVAQGAAEFGMVKRGEGVKIAAGLARTYYIGIDDGQPRAVCLLPAGLEPGNDVCLEQPAFDLTVATPIELPVFASSIRLNDQPGAIVELDRDQFKTLPPIRTVIEAGKGEIEEKLPVELHAALSEIGTIDLTCHEVEGTRSWKLMFDARSAVQTDIDAIATSGEEQGILDESIWRQCAERINAAFVSKESDPDRLVPALSELLEGSRESWRPSALRRLWEELWRQEEGRKRSAKHEARWLNLVGYLLRPGYGMAMDDWRVSMTWKAVQGRLFHASARNRTESLILWRRLSGGLSSGQQENLAGPLLNAIRQTHRQVTTGRGKGSQVEFGSHEATEIWRMLGSLERLPKTSKIELGKLILDLINRKKFQPSRDGMLWALGRIGSRRPMYGMLNDVLPVSIIAEWLDRLRAAETGKYAERLTAMQLARKCDDRYRDIDEATRTKVIGWLETFEDSAGLVKLVTEVSDLDQDQRDAISGDRLPVGLSIRGL